METEESGIFDGRLPAMVRTQLAELVHANGPVILEDPKRVKAMLSDTVATARREINLISLALSEGVAERLLAVRDDPLRLQAEQAELIRQLVANHALHADAATWAVESCAWSLGIAVSAEPLRHTAARDTGPSQPRTTPGPSQQAPTPPQTVVSSVFEAEQPQPPRPEPPPPIQPTASKVTSKPSRVPWIVAAAAAAIVALVVAAAVVATRGHGRAGATSGDGGVVAASESGGVVAASESGEDFSAADQRLMKALPGAAPRDCHVPDAGSLADLSCDGGELGKVKGWVYYQSFRTDDEANQAVLPWVNHSAKPWTTASGDAGGLVGTGTNGGPVLVWSFRIGSDVWEGEAFGPDSATLDDWWRTNVIASPELTAMTVDR